MINNIEEYKKTLDEYKSIVGPTSESNEIKQDLIEYVERLEVIRLHTPYQSCPVCDGSGITPVDKRLNTTTDCRTGYDVCTACSGTKIIPMNNLKG